MRNTALAENPGSDPLRARNRRTGLVLFGIALVFFVAVVLKYALR